MESAVSRGAQVTGWCGLVLHGLMFFWYAGSGLLAPYWAVAVLLLIWVALLAAGWWLLRRHPVAVLLVPLTALALWVLVVSAGDAWLGWAA
ncbi:MAG TPA: hypothetical protein VNV66_03355 [Pilimelia sp.]|nr:hypothetical protein [Pilimelia sp.]